MPIVPDTKNWTWVLDRPCPECGFDASLVELADIPGLARANAALWPAVLARSEATVRPDDSTWAPLEYAAHVRDVYRIMAVRLGLILDEENPDFPNWDQDVTAVEDRYLEQDPETVARELVGAADGFARAVSEGSGVQLDRTGRRGDGAVFTFRSLAAYAIHDPIHHANDVGA